jgi:hypothetical protein
MKEKLWLKFKTFTYRNMKICMAYISDTEKSIVIERLTYQLGGQEKKIQVMELTIESLMKDVAKLSSTKQEKDERFGPKLNHNLSSNDRDKMIIQGNTRVSGKTYNQSNSSQVYTSKTQSKKKALETKTARHGKQVSKNMAISIAKTGIYGEGNKEYGKEQQLKLNKKRFVANIEGPVAFHAVSDKGKISHLGSNENIKFETILLNAGGGYHSQHGLFIAPKAGIYLFSTSVLTAQTMAYSQITKNGTPLAKVYGLGNSAIAEQGSVTVATQLNSGDEVWVKHIYPAGGDIWGERFTSFTGVLISNISL